MTSRMADNVDSLDFHPLVSIVTPVLNMADFIEDTIQSVLTQNYPHIEYIVIDGGSTDGTLKILEKYRHRLVFESGPDGGAAQAINRGIRLSHGSIIAYLNADDTYLPGAVRIAVDRMSAAPHAGGVYGRATWVAEDGSTFGDYPVRSFDPEELQRGCFICQPAAFLRRDVFEQAGMLNPDLQFSFDYDLWIRISRFARLEMIDEILATSRMHRGNKTLGQKKGVLEETIRMLRGHFGYVSFSWIYSYACYLVDGRDQFFQPLQPSLAKYALSFFIGSYYNRRHLLRYYRDWASAMTVQGLMRRLTRRQRRN